MKTRLSVLLVITLLLALSAPGLRRAVLSGAGLGLTEVAMAHAATPASAPTHPGYEVNEAEEHLAESESGEGAPFSATGLSVMNALAKFNGVVTHRSHPEALRHAFHAYFAYRTAYPERVRKPYLYFVDFGLEAGTPRGYVFNMESLTLVAGPFPVSHGRGSGQGGAEAVPTRFSNVRGSNATSLGLYLAQETYGFRGRSGGRQYASVGLRLQGLSGHFNSAARQRGIVVHGAPYVTDRQAGRSEGCPAMPQPLADELLPRLANGGMVFHFSPLDTAWLREDPWVNSHPGKLASR
jgi:hypothetical protein